MEELIPTLQEEGEERIDTLQEGTIIAGVQTINGKAGDLDLKTINGQDLLTTGNLSLATTEQLATKQDQLTETQLAAVNSGIDSTKVGQIATNASNITTLQNNKQDKLTQTQLNAVNSGIDETKVAQIATNTGNITSNTNRITTIENKIPSTATSSNKLTDKDYVDNAIATNTANYISDNGQPFQSYDDLVAYSGTLTNNDYAFVESHDSAGNDIYTRYKYNADLDLWAEEYTISNPTFTSDQWASINSGVTANDVSQIGTNKSDIANLQSGKQDALSQTQLDAVNSGIDATKVQQIATNASDITNLQNDKQDKLIAGTNIQIASDGKTISATDTKYTAGTGLTLTGTQFSVTEPVPSGFFTDTQGTQTGEGTAITLDHTPNAPIDNVELKGDTKQTTLSGKNKIGLTPYKTGANYDSAVGTVISNTTDADVTIIEQTNSQLKFSSTTGFKGVVFVSSALTVGDYHLSGTITTDNNQRLSRYTLDSNYAIVRKLGNTSSSATSFTLNNNITLESGEIYIALFVASSTPYTTTVADLQLESGSTATSYEPYVGGIPSPNPDYPQQIDTVTGEQTVSVVGKNLFNKSVTPFRTGTDFYNLAVGSTITAGTSANVSVAQTSNGFTVTNSANWNGAIFLTEVKPQTSYNLKYTQTGSGSLARSSYYTLDSNYTVLTKAPISSDNFTVNTHIATTEDTKYIAVSVGGSNATTVTITEPQIELGSTATTYQPYQSQSYTIDLGAIELCKIGTYQDYIWKDGADWKIHKAIHKILLKGTENWSLGSMFYCTDAIPGTKYAIAPTNGNIKSDYFTYFAGAGAGLDMSIDIVNGYVLRIRYSAKADVSALTAWLSTHNTTVYYALATPTDTTITDATLIAQLDALLDSTTYAPQTNYNTSTPSPNLPIILTVDTFKDNYAGLLARLEKAGA